MFTGIVEELGKLKRKERKSGINTLLISISKKDFLSNVQVGDSILVNGVCLTVIKLGNLDFTVEFMPETEKITTITNWKTGQILNLEKSLRPNRGLDGHIVQGHIDGIGQVSNISIKGNNRVIKISASPELLKFIVKKGSIAIDGISLTVSDVNRDSFEVSIIKHSFENTNLKSLKPGAKVNIETDIIGKYVEKLLNKEER